MPYPEMFVTPMRQELTRLGVEELRTEEEVDRALAETAEPTLVVVNSICGCAARNARPAVAMALQDSERRCLVAAARVRVRVPAPVRGAFRPKTSSKSS